MEPVVQHLRLKAGLPIDGRQATGDGADRQESLDGGRGQGKLIGVCLPNILGFKRKITWEKVG